MQNLTVGQACYRCSNLEAVQPYGRLLFFHWRVFFFSVKTDAGHVVVCKQLSIVLDLCVF